MLSAFKHIFENLYRNGNLCFETGCVCYLLQIISWITYGFMYEICVKIAFSNKAKTRKDEREF